MSSDWLATIGLEVHVQLATASKLFSSAPVTFNEPANACANEIDIALPGTLPVLNKEVLRMAIMFGLAVEAKIARECVFVRKNYFYPDLPKGYQTSQYEEPIVEGGRLGWVDAAGEQRVLNLTRAHLEEDAGKLLHDRFAAQTAVDLNRAGTALLEIVSEPELHNAEEAGDYLRHLHDLVCTLGICDGDMSQGSFRCDVNVSLARGDAKELGVRTEIKNLNSFRFVEKAIVGEIERQRMLLESGEAVVRQTRHYDAERDTSYPMRDKEEEMDYRYFPCPDLLPIVIDEKQIEALEASLPELPAVRQERIAKDYGLSEQDLSYVVASYTHTAYFEAGVGNCKDVKALANWMRGELAALLNREQIDIDKSPVSAERLADLVNHIQDGTLSSKTAKQVFVELCGGDEDVPSVIERLDLRQQSDSGVLASWVDEVIKENPKQVEQYRASPEDKRKRLLGFFVGAIMKRSQGKADPKALNEILLSELNKD